MIEVVKYGPIIILDDIPTVLEEGYVRGPKAPERFSTEERKQDELDGLARDIISGTVPDLYLEKIGDCTTAKQLWDCPLKMCEGSTKLNEDKLFRACQKFESFTMKDGETVEDMEIRFGQVLGDVKNLDKEKYSKREINLRIMHALPPEDWQAYTVPQQKDAKFNEMDHETLFSHLKSDELDIQRIKRVAKLKKDESRQAQSSKGEALKATDKEEPTFSLDRTQDVPEDMLTQFSLMINRFNKMESRMKKFSKFQKGNYKDRREPDRRRKEPERSQRESERSHRSRHSREKADDKKPSNHDLKDIECFGCGKMGHYRTDCPELSHTERKALRAKRDRKFEKKKAMMMDEADGTSSSSSSDSSNSSSSDDESQGLLAQDLESIADNNSADYQNGINDPEVNSSPNSHYSDEVSIYDRDTDNEDTSVCMEEVQLLMTDYSKLKGMYETMLEENKQLKFKVQSTEEILKYNTVIVQDETGIDELNELNEIKTRALEKLRTEKDTLIQQINEQDTEYARALAEIKDIRFKNSVLEERLIR